MEKPAKCKTVQLPGLVVNKWILVHMGQLCIPSAHTYICIPISACIIWNSSIIIIHHQNIPMLSLFDDSWVNPLGLWWRSQLHSLQLCLHLLLLLLSSTSHLPLALPLLSWLLLRLSSSSSCCCYTLSTSHGGCSGCGGTRAISQALGTAGRSWADAAGSCRCCRRGTGLLTTRWGTGRSIRKK